MSQSSFYMTTTTQQELSRIYHRRFIRTAAYRNRVWEVLTRDFFSSWVPPDSSVLDLGCGYGEFINQVHSSVSISFILLFLFFLLYIILRKEWLASWPPGRSQRSGPVRRTVHQPQS